MAFDITADISKVLAGKTKPGITVWNRLEGVPRTEKFDRALRAEVRDPLWMLTKQWQLGEFNGDDAGSPIDVKAHLTTTKLHKYRPAEGAVEPFDETVPLEAEVERLPIGFSQAGHEIALDVRLLMGRQWLKMLGTVAGVPAAARGEYIGEYRVHAPDPTNPADAPTLAHPEAWSNFAAASGRLMDGAKFYAHLVGGGAATDNIASLSAMAALVDPVAARFVEWFDGLFLQPAGATAWLPNRLEYQFGVAAPTETGEKVLLAEEYFHGHLDWYNFDVDPSGEPLGELDPAATPPEPHTLAMLPTQVTFNGMPNSRWWRFEDTRTNFGDVRPDTTDLAKLLLVEFGLTFANDWYVVPFTLPAGSIAEVRGVAVTNVFGEKTWVRAAGSGDDEDWQRWAMFLLSTQGEAHVPADLSLVVPPAARQVLEGRPLEDVLLARDEMANMVWGVERGIALPSGEKASGHEAAAQTRGFFERALEARLGHPPEPPAPAEGARIRYQVMTSVPENWIPMIPTHVDGDNREVQLQRAAMLRIMVGDDDPSPDPVRPRTSLLRVGLEETPAVGYLLHEEEVPRSGTHVTLSFQRTRWTAGRTFTWLGVRKRTGRGEGSSGLAFDKLVDIPPQT
ncbi:hypothetical protein LKO27_01365 [Tessaracoccus sp. OS52]|uniref:hypothetical protein n=1 Tax=Tessaracoccus sp. OS52 TaxID=2886691 RepID=UPI001D109C3A|nr:hypothetical protein [Tessaracoccus sp. OS52]MCC2592078.1 hypothetical protein [Tessaracoccus sp. OS52]